ncbi:MAG: hypothetical protein L0206_01215 [Actinobacteria bacterium]|nr:hypothetical protein [Actinomycetota bacterium]
MNVRLRWMWLLLVALGSGCGTDDGDDDNADSDADVDTDADTDADTDTDSETDTDTGTPTQSETQVDCTLPKDPGTWETFAADYVTTYCLDCHSPGFEAQAVPFTKGTGPSYILFTNDADLIRCRSTPRDCPQPDCADEPKEFFPIGEGPYPTNEERLQLVAWLAAGAPEN